MKMIELNKECWNCYGDGFIVEETTGKHEPWLQNEVQLTCDHCNGNGFVVDKDELPFRLEEIKDMLDGMRVRMEGHSKFIMQCEKGLLHELADKYRNKLDTCARGYARLKQIESKLNAML